jgi:hypothetical protein
MPKKQRAMSARFDVNDPTVFERFEKAAAVHTRASTRSKSSARKTLIREGILTRSGKIAKKYRAA